MRVVIKNEMPFTLLVAAVRTGPARIRFVFSKREIPISDGVVLGRMEVETGEMVETKGEMDTDMTTTCAQHGLADNVQIVYQEGTDQDGRDVRKFTVRPDGRDLN